MKIRVSERHTKLRPAVRQSLIEKLEGMERYFDRILSIEAAVEEVKTHYVIRLIAYLVRKRVAKAEAQSQDVYLAINEAADNLKSQLSKFKGQLKDHRLPPSAPAPAGGSRQAAARAPLDLGGGVDLDQVTRTEVYIRKPMTVEEALIQLEEVDRDLYLFEDAEVGGLRLLIRHPSGQVELLEPKY